MVIFTNLIDSLFERCRKLSLVDNESQQDFWITGPGRDPNFSRSLCALKGKRAHVIIRQDGTFSSGSSPRSRTGLWHKETRHLSSIDLSLTGRNESLKLRKYVRALGYIYRSYDSDIERIDYIPPEKGLYAIVLRAEKSISISMKLEVFHEVTWPAQTKGSKYSNTRNGTNLTVKSDIATTAIHAECDGKTDMTVSGNIVTVKLEGMSTAVVYVSCDGSALETDDLDNSINYHEHVKKKSALITPSPKFNKLFLWAKHDLLELYSESDNGSGFFAGMPVFSWFFGRDGEWMSMAATECGLHELSAKHLELLKEHSKDGRIPHEIPLFNGELSEKYKFALNKTLVNTRFMSIDSSPLWILARIQLAAWTGNSEYLQGIEEVMGFTASCDRNKDGLIDNDFSRGLIGWPESWAEVRDGTCVEVNAWWLQALRLYGNIQSEARDQYLKSLSSFDGIFFNDRS